MIIKSIFLFAVWALLAVNLPAQTNSTINGVPLLPKDQKPIVGLDKILLGDKLPDKFKLQVDDAGLRQFYCDYTNHPPFRNLIISVNDERRIYRIVLSVSEYGGHGIPGWDGIYDKLKAQYGFGVFKINKGDCRVTWEQSKRKLIFESIDDRKEYKLTYEDVEAAAIADVKSRQALHEAVKKAGAGL